MSSHKNLKYLLTVPIVISEIITRVGVSWRTGSSMGNTLYYGDNLWYLRDFDRDVVDLIYLDPPFNSKADYNLLFRTPQGSAVQAQTTAFKDTWEWDTPAATAFDDVIASGVAAAGIMRALRSFLGECDLMAYLSQMTVRLIEMHRVLKPSGSIFLHCDPTASHYLKLLLDAIFGPQHFKNELIWQRTTPKGLAFTRFPSTHDVILFYSKDKAAKWHSQFTAHRPEYVDKYYNLIEPETGRRFQGTSLINPNPDRPNLTYKYHGVTRVWRWTKDRMHRAEQEGKIYFPPGGGVPREKRFLDEQEGTPITSVWTDIPPVNSQAQERLGYPTQKPLSLLKRIIAAATNPGDVVLDPFCGCGTSIEAAQALGRSWIGVDVTHHAIDIIESRMQKRCEGAQYRVTGRPEDIDAAWDLAKRDRYEFQWWANWLIGVQNYREHKKGADKGIDGVIYFRNGPWGVGQTIVSVKSGENVGPEDVDRLSGTVKREDAQLGVLVCLSEPTRRMRQDAAGGGMAVTAQGRYQRIQVVTVSDLLEGKRPSLPSPIESDAFKRPLRPTRQPKEQLPEPQLSLALPIIGQKRKRSDVEEHLSGRLLASLTAG